MEKIDAILEKYRYAKENLIQIMLEIQDLSEKHYLPREWIDYVAEALNLPKSKVYGAITFYAMFNLEPQGKNLIEVCKSGPCHVSGSKNVVQMLEQLLGIKPGETTPDGLFSIKRVSCFGACDISPAIKIGDKVYGNLTLESLQAVINAYREGA